MATEGAVLGIIRAARPQLRSPHDRVAFAVHACFLSAGYSLVATGSQVSPDPPGVDGDTEVGIESWNETDDVYAFQYSGAGQEGCCKSVLVKCVVVGEMLMVDVAAATGGEYKEFHHVELRVLDYVTALEGTNYGQLYKRLNELVEQVNASLLSKLPGSKESASTSSKEDSTDVRGDDTADRFVALVDERPSSMPGLRYPPVPVPDFSGRSDLLPGPGAGVFPSRSDLGGGGMLVGPNDPRWGFQEGGRSGLIPPGARYDPLGPSGVPGFEPERFVRIRPPPGSGINPDLEHFQPF